MKNLKCLIPLLILALLACNNGEDADLPDCIKKEIEAFAADGNVCKGTARVVEFQFKGKPVFLFDMGNCIADGAYPVKDTDCETICTLGTIAGIIQCEGENFDEQATEIRVVWDNK